VTKLSLCLALPFLLYACAGDEPAVAVVEGAECSLSYEDAQATTTSVTCWALVTPGDSPLTDLRMATLDSDGVQLEAYDEVLLTGDSWPPNSDVVQEISEEQVVIGKSANVDGLFATIDLSLDVCDDSGSCQMTLGSASAASDTGVYLSDGELKDCADLDRCTETDYVFRIFCCEFDSLLCNPDPTCPQSVPASQE
jgi:hypothetical protein